MVKDNTVTCPGLFVYSFCKQQGIFYTQSLTTYRELNVKHWLKQNINVLLFLYFFFKLKDHRNKIT